jgi:hypothetical protein
LNPLDERTSFSPRYAPGRCVFDTALDTTKPATVVIPTFKQNIKLALSAYPTQPLDGVAIGLGRIVALYYRSSTSYQIRQHIRCLYF